MNEYVPAGTHSSANRGARGYSSSRSRCLLLSRTRSSSHRVCDPAILSNPSSFRSPCPLLPSSSFLCSTPPLFSLSPASHDQAGSPRSPAPSAPAVLPPRRRLRSASGPSLPRAPSGAPAPPPPLTSTALSRATTASTPSTSVRHHLPAAYYGSAPPAHRTALNGVFFASPRLSFLGRDKGGTACRVVALFFCDESPSRSASDEQERTCVIYLGRCRDCRPDCWGGSEEDLVELWAPVKMRHCSSLILEEEDEEAALVSSRSSISAS